MPSLPEPYAAFIVQLGPGRVELTPPVRVMDDSGPAARYSGASLATTGEPDNGGGLQNLRGHVTDRSDLESITGCVNDVVDTFASKIQQRSQVCFEGLGVGQVAGLATDAIRVIWICFFQAFLSILDLVGGGA